MHEGRRAGRPRAVSREMLAEAACELFLEQGYAATSVADITQRAGVSRATFFNYIPTKSDLLWTSVDDALDSLVPTLAEPGGVDDVRAALLQVAEGLVPDAAVLAFANAEPMGVAEELEESAARRQRRATALIAAHLSRAGHDELEAEVLGAALGGALLAALRAWARSAPGRTAFVDVLRRALDVVR